MGIYSVDKLMTEARRLAREYRQTTGKTLPITGEIATNDAIQLLKLTPNEMPNQGYDAIMEYRNETLRVQIKGRAIFDEYKSGHRLGQLKIDQEWDAVLLVIMGGDYETQEIYMAMRDDIMDVSKKSKSKKGSITVARFKIIGELLWTVMDGIEDKTLWTNP